MDKNIAAFTALGDRPPYLSINRLPDDSVEVTVRNRDGATVTVQLNGAEWFRIVHQAAVEAGVEHCG